MHILFSTLRIVIIIAPFLFAMKLIGNARTACGFSTVALGNSLVWMLLKDNYDSKNMRLARSVHQQHAMYMFGRALNPRYDSVTNPEPISMTENGPIKTHPRSAPKNSVGSKSP